MRPFINKLFNFLTLYKNRVSIGCNVSIDGRLIVYGDNIFIGDNVNIHSRMSTNPIGGSSNTCLSTYFKGKISIGNNVGMSNVALCSLASIVIEDDVMLGGGCKIYDTDFHSLDYEKRMMNPDPDIHSAPVRIKKGAFIGAHSIILKGVTIGEKSIVGAGSIVTKNVPDGEIWAGNPAKFIKKISQRVIIERAPANNCL